MPISSCVCVYTTLTIRVVHGRGGEAEEGDALLPSSGAPLGQVVVKSAEAVPGESLGQRLVVQLSVVLQVVQQVPIMAVLEDQVRWPCQSHTVTESDTHIHRVTHRRLETVLNTHVLVSVQYLKTCSWQLHVVVIPALFLLDAGF